MLAAAKRYAMVLFLLVVSALSALAQSSMTDQQIMDFVIAEQEKGTSQSQIVTKLMQRGVTVDQLRSVKKKYERQAKEQGLGTVDITTSGNTSANRLRKNNGDQKQTDKHRRYCYHSDGFCQMLFVFCTHALSFPKKNSATVPGPV